MGIDVGTTTISIVLMDMESRELKAHKTVPHNSFRDGGTSAEKIQDPERIWRITRENADAMFRTFGMPEGIGITGQMHGMLYVDREGQAVSPLYTWQDRSGDLPLYEGKSSADIMKERVGAAASGYGLTTHYYLQEKGRIPGDAGKMTTISDYIVMKLCRHKFPVIGPGMAASWGCFDLKEKTFLYDALKRAGVDTSFLPEVREEPFIAGKTLEGIPVMAAIGDNQASFVGAVGSGGYGRGMEDGGFRDTVLINVGTGSQVSFVSEQYISCEGTVELRPFTKESYLLAGSPLCGGRAYAMLEKFYREAAGTDGSYYDVMYRQAQDFISRFGIGNAWKVTTTFSGTRNDPGERGRMEGIGVENFHPGALTAGVIRGILEELYRQYVYMCELTGKKAKRLVGSGNGLRRNLLMQKLAEDMFGLKLEIPVCQEEAACGAAMLMEELLT